MNNVDTIKSKVVKYSSNRKFIEVPKIYWNDFPHGTTVMITKA